MRTSLQKSLAAFRRGAALFLVLAVLAAVVPAAAESVKENTIDEYTGETQETLAHVMLEKRKATDGAEGLENIRVHRNGQIHGRGFSDEPSGAEPNYTGLVGYAVTANSDDIKPGDKGLDYPWKVPSYLVFEKRWYYTQPLQHKTSVLVLNQVLKEKSRGRYTGRLWVIRLDSGEICWMDVEDFITVPYWFYPAKRAVKYGSTVATYRKKGEAVPTNLEGNPIEVERGTSVLIPGNDVWDIRAPEGSRMIPGIVYTAITTVVTTTVLKTGEEPEDAGDAEATVNDGEGETTKVTEKTEIISTIILFPEEDLTVIY